MEDERYDLDELTREVHDTWQTPGARVADLDEITRLNARSKAALTRLEAHCHRYVARGGSYAELAAALGVTRQAARQRFAPDTPRPEGDALPF